MIDDNMSGQTLSSTARKHYIDEEGVKRVDMPEDEYERLKEDIYDVAVYLERKDDATITEEEYKKWLKDEGLL
jgi:hypothetical protein